MTEPLRVSMVLDFVCLESYLGFTRLVRAIDQVRRRGLAVEPTIEPFQLRPDASFEGEPLFEQHRRERGEEVAREIANGSYGVEDGLTVRLGSAWFTNTFRAHRLQARAAVFGLAVPMAERLFRAYYTDGLDLADPTTLGRLATEVGVPRTAESDGPDPGPGTDDHLRRRLDEVRGRVADRPPEFWFGDGDPATADVLVGLRTEAELVTALTGAGATPG